MFRHPTSPIALQHAQFSLSGTLFFQVALFVVWCKERCNGSIGFELQDYPFGASSFECFSSSI
jgi:hypothetical protein